jgi:hypothetical protein
MDAGDLVVEELDLLPRRGGVRLPDEVLHDICR